MSFSGMFYDLARQMDEFERALNEAWTQSNLATEMPTNSSTSSAPAPAPALPSHSPTTNRRSPSPTPQRDSDRSNTRPLPDTSKSCPAVMNTYQHPSPWGTTRNRRGGFAGRNRSTSPASRRVSPFKQALGNRRMVEGRMPMTTRSPWWPENQFPSMDVRETDEAVVVEANVPGYRKRDLKLTVHERSLTLSGETGQDTEERDEDRGYYRRERRCGQFTRTVCLPCDVNPNGVRASCENGVVRVTLPKTPQAVGQEICFDDCESDRCEKPCKKESCKMPCEKEPCEKESCKMPSDTHLKDFVLPEEFVLKDHLPPTFARPPTPPPLPPMKPSSRPKMM